MTFKRHQYGDQSKRPAVQEFEAQFHQLLVPALVASAQKGNKKRQGYIMGAFREALANFRIRTPEEAAKVVELNAIERNFLLSHINKMREEFLELEQTSELPEDRKDARKDAALCSSIKMKLTVTLFGVKNDL